MQWATPLKHLLLRAILWFTDDPSVYASVACTCKVASVMAREMAPMKKKDFSRTIHVRTSAVDPGYRMRVLPNGNVHGVVTYNFTTLDHQLVTVFQDCLVVGDARYPQNSELWFGLDQLARKGDKVSCSRHLMVVSMHDSHVTLRSLANPLKGVECWRCPRCKHFHSFFTLSTHAGGRHFLLSKPCNATRLVAKEVYSRHEAGQVTRRHRIAASFFHAVCHTKTLVTQEPKRSM